MAQAVARGNELLRLVRMRVVRFGTIGVWRKILCARMPLTLGRGLLRRPIRRQNIRTALAITSVTRAEEGGGAAWKMKGRNSEAWHISKNCDAASSRSSITSSPAFDHLKMAGKTIDGLLQHALVVATADLRHALGDRHHGADRRSAVGAGGSCRCRPRRIPAAWWRHRPTHRNRGDLALLQRRLLDDGLEQAVLSAK